MSSPLSPEREAPLPIPGATKLAVSDWQELLRDVADVYDKLFGLQMKTAADVRAFAKHLPNLLAASSSGIEGGELPILLDAAFNKLIAQLPETGAFIRQLVVDALQAAQQCAVCDGSGEVYEPTSIPDDEGWNSCLACNGTGTRLSCDEVYRLAEECETAKGDLQATEYEVQQYKERLASAQHRAEGEAKAIAHLRQLVNGCSCSGCKAHLTDAWNALYETPRPTHVEGANA